MTGILVPFDGSKHSLKALHIACDLAEKYKDKVFLLYVVKVESSFNVSEVNKETQDIAENIIRKAAAKAKYRGVEYKVLDFEYGDPASSILACVKRHKPSTLVMGCRGLNADIAEILGTVSRTVFEHADCTCIAVKQLYHSSSAFVRLAFLVQTKNAAQICGQHFKFLYRNALFYLRISTS